jgi:DeoR/GlpR family transcriptional regulator of sugar metabolism
MQNDLFLEERRQAILDLIETSGRVSVTELRQQFSVSEVTIRADLQALANDGLLVRTHGGAVPALKVNQGLQELSLAVRRQKQVAQKNDIAKQAATMIHNGEAIILDTSSTALAIAACLKNHRELTIVTNSLIVAVEMLDAPGVSVVMPGGTVRRDSASLVGADGLELVNQFNIQKGFFGAHGLTEAEGLTDVSAAEAKMKRPLVAMTRQVIAVLDASKLGQVGLMSFAQIEDIDCVITDAQAPSDMVARLREKDIEVILA